MKGFFSDSKDWDIVVWGDWRDKEGKPAKYVPENGLKEIHITGGSGSYLYQKGRFKTAYFAYRNDLLLIKKIEREEKRRFHKGLFYYQMALCCRELGWIKDFEKNRKLASDEDKETYGRLAATFPATRYLQLAQKVIQVS